MAASTSYRRGASPLGPRWTPTHCLDTSTRYVEIPHLGLHLPTDDITIEFWARFTAARRTVAFQLSSLNYDRILAHLPWENNQILWDHGDLSNPNAQTRTVADASGLVNQWNHFEFSVGAQNNQRTIRLNGDALRTDVGYNPFTPNDSSFYIGWWNFPDDPHFPGQLGEFRIWSTVRSPSQIKRYSPFMLDNPHPHLLACWRLDDNVPVGGQIRDYSGNGFHGILH